MHAIVQNVRKYRLVPLVCRLGLTLMIFILLRGLINSVSSVADIGRTKTGLFCPECGTRICNKPGSGALVVVKAGSLDNPNWFNPIAHIWTRSAQSWFPFADGLPKFEQAPEDMNELNRLWSAHVAGE